jgi:hypothetical protein
MLMDLTVVGNDLGLGLFHSRAVWLTENPVALGYVLVEIKLVENPFAFLFAKASLKMKG